MMTQKSNRGCDDKNEKKKKSYDEADILVSLFTDVSQ